MGDAVMVRAILVVVALAFSAGMTACGGDDDAVAIAESDIGDRTSTSEAEDVAQTGDDAVAPTEESEELGFAAAAGRWTTDDVDGSNIVLTLGERDGRIEFSYRDDGGTVCGLDAEGNPQYGIGFEGSTVVEELTLSVDDVPATCDVTGEMHPFDWTLTYGPASDTLLEEVSTEIDGEVLSETYTYERL